MFSNTIFSECFIPQNAIFGTLNLNFSVLVAILFGIILCLSIFIFFFAQLGQRSRKSPISWYCLFCAAGTLSILFLFFALVYAGYKGLINQNSLAKKEKTVVSVDLALKAPQTKKNNAENSTTDSDLTDSNLTDSNLTDSNLTDSNLTDSNLTDSNLTDSNLTDPDLTDSNLTDPNLSNTSDFQTVSQSESVLTEKNSDNSKLTRSIPPVPSTQSPFETESKSSQPSNTETDQEKALGTKIGAPVAVQDIPSAQFLESVRSTEPSRFSSLPSEHPKPMPVQTREESVSQESNTAQQLPADKNDEKLSWNPILPVAATQTVPPLKPTFPNPLSVYYSAENEILDTEEQVLMDEIFTEEEKKHLPEFTAWKELEQKNNEFILKKAIRSVVQIEAQIQDFNPRNTPSIEYGSGIVAKIQNYYCILSNVHVVNTSNPADVKIIKGNYSFHPKKILSCGDAFDIAVLIVDKNDLERATPPLRPMTFAPSSDLAIGQQVFVIGHPFNLSQSSTSGMVCTVEQKNVPLGSIRMQMMQNYIQTDAAINSGNSGGPLLNFKGQCVGIVTGIASNQGGGSCGVGFAIPNDIALVLAHNLISFGECRLGNLGVALDPAYTAEESYRAGLKEYYGARILIPQPEVHSGNSSLQTDDIILEYQGKKVLNSEDLLQKVNFTPVDNKNSENYVKLKILRNGKFLDSYAKLNWVRPK